MRTQLAVRKRAVIDQAAEESSLIRTCQERGRGGRKVDSSAKVVTGVASYSSVNGGTGAGGKESGILEDLTRPVSQTIWHPNKTLIQFTVNLFKSVVSGSF